MDPAGTDTHPSVPAPNLFMPHPGFSDEVNRNIVQSEIEGGVHLDGLGNGAVLEVETQNHYYTIVKIGGAEALISGHPQYCPDPVQVRIEGSTWGGSMLKIRYIGRGMRLEFMHPTYRTIRTSRIVEIRAKDHLMNARPDPARISRSDSASATQQRSPTPDPTLKQRNPPKP